MASCPSECSVDDEDIAAALLHAGSRQDEQEIPSCRPTASNSRFFDTFELCEEPGDRWPVLLVNDVNLRGVPSCW